MNARRSLQTIFLIAALAGGFGKAAMKTGPAVGDRIPNFALPDQNGRGMNLKAIAGPKGAMLVFYRSADW